MNFNLNTRKKVQEIIFSREVNENDQPFSPFNQNLVKSASTQKHLGILLDTELDFHLYLKM